MSPADSQDKTSADSTSRLSRSATWSSARVSALGRFWFYRFFEHLYTDLAWAYDLAAWLASGGLWYEWVDVAARFVAGDPVLEVGFGRGHLLVRLARQGHTVVGVDRSPQMVAAARRTVAAAGVPVRLVQGDGTALPFADSTFGTLITTFPAPYVLTEGAQREFARVLQPGGRWVWVDAPRWLRWPRRMAALWLLQNLLPGPTEAQLPLVPQFTLCSLTVPVAETTVRVLLLEKQSLGEK